MILSGVYIIGECQLYYSLRKEYVSEYVKSANSNLSNPNTEH